MSRCPQLVCPPFTLVEERVQVLSRSTWIVAVQAGSESIFTRGGGRGGEEPRGFARARSERKRGQGRIVRVGITMCMTVCVYI